MTLLEKRRLALQDELDGTKDRAERNRLGQFATPTALAVDILEYAKNLRSSNSGVRFLDPAIGTGSFYSALLKVFKAQEVVEAVGFEIDPHYGEPAARLWQGNSLRVHLADFTKEDPQPKFDLVICNPPYVRHHHISNEDKTRLQSRTARSCGLKLTGLAGLYCHFMGQAHAWLAPGAISVWLVPSEFMDVNYGRALKRYLLERVTLLHIHRFDPNDVQFADALVSSAVVCFRNTPPPTGHAIKFTFGGTVSTPNVSKEVSSLALSKEQKWTRFPLAEVRPQADGATLSDFFQIKRGLATGDNAYFILDREEIERRCLPIECFSPILPSPRYLDSDEVRASRDGSPDLSRRLFLLDTKLPPSEIRSRYPSLAAYLDEGEAKGLHDRYLCRHRQPWYVQETRPAAPIVCTYLGRGDTKSGRPFRFILNHSQAKVANVYLAMYPTAAMANALGRDPELLRRVWQALNDISAADLLGEGRVYGGGLHKLEPSELANVSVPELAKLLPARERDLQEQLF